MANNNCFFGQQFAAQMILKDKTEMNLKQICLGNIMVDNEGVGDWQSTEIKSRKMIISTEHAE